MSENKTSQIGVKPSVNIASVRLPANVMTDFRAAVALKETTIQQVLEQAVRVYLASTHIKDKK